MTSHELSNNAAGISLLRLDVQDMDVHGVMALRHRLDAVDDRRVVVVAVGKPDGSHGCFLQVRLERTCWERWPLGQQFAVTGDLIFQSELGENDPEHGRITGDDREI